MPLTFLTKLVRLLVSKTEREEVYDLKEYDQIFIFVSLEQCLEVFIEEK